MYTCVKFPLGFLQLGGSLIERLMVPVEAEAAGVEDPEPQPDSKRIESMTTDKA
jgi:hypothetical protein